MPRHRRRPGLSRFLLPAVLGAIALAGMASLLPGMPFSSRSAEVAGVTDIGDVEVTPAGRLGGVAGGRAERQSLSRGGQAIDPSPSASADGELSTGDTIEPAEDPRPAAPASLTGYQWPLPHGRITLPFGPSKWGSRLVDGEPFHDGLDLATFCGDRIVAAHDGVVLAASRHYDTKMGWVGDLQPYLDRLDAKSLWSTLPIVVVIDDGNGYRSIYAHLSKAVVKKGDVVAAGTLIGYEGKTGRASGCHLHYGLFSPLETEQFGIDPGVVERMKLPAWQIARIDPQLVLPERPGDHRADTPIDPGAPRKPPLAAE